MIPNRLPLLWLEEIGVEDRPVVGGKAAALGALLRQGLPVPPGFCLPVGSRSDEQDRVWQALWAAYLRLAPGCGPVAVRSSGVQEDGTSASYAGQFETLLDVQGEAALKEAVARVQESLHSARASIYRESRGAEGKAGSAAGMAVLVQRQVPAAVSGVLFTRDPVTGDGSQVLIEAALGLGDSLVAGRTRVQPARVGPDGSVHQPGDHPLLSEAECQALARLGRQVEQVLGPAQDIEWAIGPGGKGEREIFILQARPVTAPAAQPPLNTVWTRANIGEVLPDPVTPLTWSVFQSMLLGNASEEGKASGAPVLHRHLGRAYLRLDALLDSFCYLPGVTPERLKEVLGVEMPAVGKGYSPPRGMAVRLAQLVFWLDALVGAPRLGWLAHRSLPPAGHQNINGMLAWTAACFRLHLKATASAIAAYSALKALSYALPEQDQEQVARLMRGSADMQTAAQGRELWRLAEQAFASPALKELLHSEPGWDVLKVKAVLLPGGAEFVAALEAFLEANGARAAGEFELAAPRWREQPERLLQVLRLHILSMQPGGAPAAPFEAGGEQANRQVAARLGPARRALYRRMLAAYRRYSTLRENLKFRLIEGYAGMRRYFLDLGGRLHTADLLPATEDIFYLDMDEIRSLQAGSLPAAQAVRLVQQRREEWARWESIPVPDLLAGGGFGEAGSTSADPGTLIGIGCCPGTVTGRARVLHNIEESASLQPGEILVAPHTDPGWTPLFLSCKAVVTELGGFLSHGATVAREYGVPCVASVHAATQRIRTGDWIQVDGMNGRVVILPGGQGGNELTYPASSSTIQ